MQKGIGFLAAVAMALAWFCQGAEAGVLRHHHDKRLVATGFVAGAAGTATYFALRDWRWRHPPNAKISEGGAMIAGTAVCAVLSPMLGTLAVNRELTLREAYVMTADCVIPFVGGWLMNKAFDAHPEWEGRRARRHRH